MSEPSPDESRLESKCFAHGGKMLAIPPDCQDQREAAAAAGLAQEMCGDAKKLSWGLLTGWAGGAYKPPPLQGNTPRRGTGCLGARNFQKPLGHGICRLPRWLALLFDMVGLKGM